jgi:hypothetical protein
MSFLGGMFFYPIRCCNLDPMFALSCTVQACFAFFHAHLAPHLGRTMSTHEFRRHRLLTHFTASLLRISPPIYIQPHKTWKIIWLSIADSFFFPMAEDIHFFPPSKSKLVTPPDTPLSVEW